MSEVQAIPEKNKILKCRADFPLLSKRVRGKNLVYLDSAATALKPWPVIERISHFYTYETANVHRGAHYLADQATGFFEQSRDAVRSFINAVSSDEIVFTKGTTESLNLVAQTWAKANLKAGDEILLTEMEHHANIVPWQMIAEDKSAKIVAARIHDNGELDMEDVQKKLSSGRVKIFAFTACSNVLGTINDSKKLVSMAHAAGAVAVVDAAQLVSNHPIDVQDWKADFLAFSGHKIFGPYGVGVLYARKELLESMPPYQGGGSMISQVSFARTTYNTPPLRFEAGTPNIEAVIALKPALDYVLGLGWPQILEHEQNLLRIGTEKLSEIPEVKIFGTAKNKAPVVSFVLQGAHHSDVGQLLDQENVAVRVGHHCAQPLMERLGITGTVRASFSVFNTPADIDAFINALKKAKELLL
jgi:cysteine desulfurase/selenocysteine lyase